MQSQAQDIVIDDFLIKAKRIFRRAEPSHIVNADESFWRCMEYHHRTWAPTNSSNVLMHTEGSEKSGFTALATVARDGQKFPLILISKGTTVKSESNWFGSGRSLNVKSNQIPEALSNPFFNDTSSRFSSHETITPESLTDHSPKGWTNRTTWSNYLKALRYKFIKPIDGIDFYDVRNRIFLFIDAYRVHKCEEIIDLAAGLNIDVTVIPEGMTEVHQPLDIKLFGIMKAKARAF